MVSFGRASSMTVRGHPVASSFATITGVPAGSTYTFHGGSQYDYCRIADVSAINGLVLCDGSQDRNSVQGVVFSSRGSSLTIGSSLIEQKTPFGSKAMHWRNALDRLFEVFGEVDADVLILPLEVDSHTTIKAVTSPSAAVLQSVVGCKRNSILNFDLSGFAPSYHEITIGRLGQIIGNEFACDMNVVGSSNPGVPEQLQFKLRAQVTPLRFEFHPGNTMKVIDPAYPGSRLHINYLGVDRVVIEFGNAESEVEFYAGADDTEYLFHYSNSTGNNSTVRFWTTHRSVLVNGTIPIVHVGPPEPAIPVDPLAPLQGMVAVSRELPMTIVQLDSGVGGSNAPKHLWEMDQVCLYHLDADLTRTAETAASPWMCSLLIENGFDPQACSGCQVAYNKYVLFNISFGDNDDYLFIYNGNALFALNSGHGNDTVTSIYFLLISPHLPFILLDSLLRVPLFLPYWSGICPSQGCGHADYSLLHQRCRQEGRRLP